MRRSISCVLMMILLLTACGMRTQDDPDELAARIRTEYLSASGGSAAAEISADYGEQVFDFTVNADWEREGDLVLTVTAPEPVAGITARIRDGETCLEYDGMGLSLGALDGEGLTPVSALPALLERICTGYIARCSWFGEGAQRELRLLCRDPENAPEEGVEYLICIDPATHALTQAQVSVDGVLRLRVRFTQFTLEMTENGTGTDEDLGGDQPGQSGA